VRGLVREFTCTVSCTRDSLAHATLTRWQRAELVADAVRVSREQRRRQRRSRWTTRYRRSSARARTCRACASPPQPGAHPVRPQKPPPPGPSTPALPPADSFDSHDACDGCGVGVGDALAASEELQVALEAIGRPQRVLLPVVVVTVFHTVHIPPLTTVLTTVLAHSPARLRQWLLVPLDRDAWEHCR
jgi:hypothetical protein